MMKSKLAVLVVCSCLLGATFATGCDAGAEPVVEVVGEAAPQEQEKKDSAIDKAKEMFRKVEGQETADGVKKWLGDKLNKVSETGDGVAKTADETVDWATNMFKQLKDQGLTNADNAKDWLAEDFASMGAWEYKVIKMETGQTSARLEVSLNKLGQDRWECFSIQSSADATMYHFKRQKQSYLKSLPFKDMIQLFPLMASGEEEGQ